MKTEEEKTGGNDGGSKSSPLKDIAAGTVAGLAQVAVGEKNRDDVVVRSMFYITSCRSIRDWTAQGLLCKIAPALATRNQCYIRCVKR